MKGSLWPEEGGDNAFLSLPFVVPKKRCVMRSEAGGPNWVLLCGQWGVVAEKRGRVLRHVGGGSV